jgi:hypothetical protein
MQQPECNHNRNAFVNAAQAFRWVLDHSFDQAERGQLLQQVQVEAGLLHVDEEQQQEPTSFLQPPHSHPPESVATAAEEEGLGLSEGGDEIEDAQLPAAGDAEVAATPAATPPTVGDEGATLMDIDVPAQSIRAASALPTPPTLLSALATGMMAPRGQPTAELEATGAAGLDARDTEEHVAQDQMHDSEFEAASQLGMENHQEETDPAAQEHAPWADESADKDTA